MNTLVENVLDLSRRKSPQTQPLNLKTWLNHTLDELCSQIGLDRATLKLEPTPDDLFMLADPNHLRQILWNLLRNAQTYAQSQEKLQIHVKSQIHLNPRQVQINITDNGPGIPGDIEDKLFEPFFTTGAEGTGLGLYIAKELCESNGGALEHCQQNEKGSCFRITLPLKDSVTDPVYLNLTSEASRS